MSKFFKIAAAITILVPVALVGMFADGTRVGDEASCIVHWILN